MNAAAQVAEPIQITKPGLYEDIPDDIYHADPVPGGSLSSTGARKILPPGCPALFAYEREHGRPDKRAFDFGHAAHAKVLGVGAPVAVIPDEALSSNGGTNTNAAKEFIAAARKAGAVPLKSSEAAEIDAMAEALLANPIAAALLQPGSGRAEVSGFHIDQRSDAWLRVRYDWLPHPRDDGRLIIPDYKTSHSASPEEFARSAANYGYPQQDAFYTDAARALELAEDIAFVFVVQEKTPPYLVTVCELDNVAKRIGRNRNRQAIDLYADCTNTGEWPAYMDDVALVSLPSWYERRQEEM